MGATSTDLDAYLPVAERACGLKIYVSETFGSLRIDSLELMHRFFRTWAECGSALGYRSPENPSRGIGPIAVHAEELMLSVCLNLSHLYQVPLHIVHVSRRSEIELIRTAKERGYPVTCEVTPHHLFLDERDAVRLGSLGDMRPKLAAPDDVAALWENLEFVDIFATDHAPHTLAEKGISLRADGQMSPTAAPTGSPTAAPPPGVPGVETMLPLLITAVHAEQISWEDLLTRCVVNPRRIYGLPLQPETEVTVDVDAEYLLHHEAMHTRVGWTPFAGRRVRGRVERVRLRGVEVFADGQLLAEPGSGRLLFQNES
ncbi:MAG: hypothetical protein HC802_14090 [Caldilineaceae bacterium]|nr:hypothetical protein [Caldilineaceae bacterium]